MVEVAIVDVGVPLVGCWIATLLLTLLTIFGASVVWRIMTLATLNWRPLGDTVDHCWPPPRFATDNGMPLIEGAKVLSELVGDGDAGVGLVSRFS